MDHPQVATGVPGGEIAWLLDATNRMLACRDVATLLDLAYDAVRAGLGYDRVGLVLVDHERRTLTERIGTDEAGRKFYPADRAWSLDDPGANITLLTDPRLQPDGPGFVYLANAMRDLPRSRRRYLDGQPAHTLRVALRTPEKVVGLISVDNLTSGRPIYPSDAPPLVAFANALAGAVDNLMLLDERARRIERLDAALHRRVEELSWLQQTADQLGRLHDVESALDAICAAVRDGLGCDGVGLFLVEQGSDGRPWIARARGADERDRLIPRLARGLPLDDPAVSLHAPEAAYLHRGQAAYHWTARALDSQSGHGSGHDHTLRGDCLAVALRHDGAMIGYLSVTGGLSGRPIAETDAAPLATFAAQAALTISRARLLQRERDERLAAQESQRRLAFVAQASAVLAGSLDYTTTLATMARLAVPELADCCMVDLVERDSSFGQTAVAHHDPTLEEMVRTVRQRHPPAPEGTHAFMRVVRTGQPLVVAEVTDEWLRSYTRSDEHFTVMKHLGLRSYMAVPLATGGRVLGALTFLSSVAERRYGPVDLALAEEVGHHAALAIDNARLYREAQEAVRVRDHFLMSASHDLRTPLTVISGHAAMMSRRLERDETVDAGWMRARLSGMRAAAGRMVSTVEEITDAAQLQMGHTLALDLSTLDVGTMVHSVVDILMQAQRDGSVAPLLVEAPAGLTIEGDRARLERVVQNVIGNAIKYSPQDTPVHVSLAQSEGHVTMTVRDRGVGIPAGELPHIFTPFYRASTSKGIAGTGIGLAGSKTIVEQHGGHLSVESVAGEGTTVVVSLPCAAPPGGRQDSGGTA